MQTLAELIYALEPVQSKGSCLAERSETSYTSVRISKCQIMTLETCFLVRPHFLTFTALGHWSVYINVSKTFTKIRLLKSRFYSDFQWNDTHFLLPPQTVNTSTSNHFLICQSWVQIPAQPFKSFWPRPYHQTSWSSKIISVSISLDLYENLIG